MTLRQASQTHAATCASAHETKHWRTSCLCTGCLRSPAQPALLTQSSSLHASVVLRPLRVGTTNRDDRRAVIGP